jgi:SOS-response transcriptional repressor LexA
MIRLTLITGAGKGGRQRYDPEAQRVVTSTLKDLGYVDDRAASCVAECAGSFKIQHDTGKNLKTVVVFPKLATKTQDGSDKPKLDTMATEVSFLLKGSPDYMIATSSIPNFSRLVQSKCPSWSQKKGCLIALEKLREKLKELDSKLLSGMPLNPVESEFYDSVVFLDKKEDNLRTEMHQQVEQGDITAWEKEVLLNQNAERIITLRQKDEKLSSPSNSRLQQLEKALQRKQILTDIIPRQPRGLRHEEAIRKLRRELLPYLRMEEELKGRLRTIQETQAMAKKDEIENQITHLEEQSREWFEDNMTFQSRVMSSRNAFASILPKSHGKKNALNSNIGKLNDNLKDNPHSSAVGKWVLPGDMQKGKAGSHSIHAKKNKVKGGTVFSSITIDDDDDDDDHNVDDLAQQNNSKQSHGPIPAIEKSTKDVSSMEPCKKNKKKPKKKEKLLSEDAALNQAYKVQQRAQQKVEQEKKEASQVSNPVWGVIQNTLVPIIIAILTWLIQILLGKPKKRKDKDVKYK